MPFCPAVFPSRTRRKGPAQRAAASGLLPFRESLTTGRGLTRRPLEAPLGFVPSRAFDSDLAWVFAQAPSTRFAAIEPEPDACRRLEVSVSLCLVSMTRADKRPLPETTLIGFLHQHAPDR